MLRARVPICKIALNVGIDRNRIYSRFRDWGIDIRAERKQLFSNLVDHDFFESIDSETKAYWLGFLMADGCVYRSDVGKNQARLQLKLASKDKGHIEQLAKDLRFKGNIWDHILPGNLTLPTTTLFIVSGKICDDLERQGCIQRKSMTLRFPQHILPGLRKHLIRGYFDGDGCAGIRVKSMPRPTLRISMLGTWDFLSHVAIEIGKACGFVPFVRPSRNIFAIEICGNRKSPRVRDWMYGEATIFLPRKREVCFAAI